jgi:hypothetical protein
MQLSQFVLYVLLFLVGLIVWMVCGFSMHLPRSHTQNTKSYLHQQQHFVIVSSARMASIKYICNYITIHQSLNYGVGLDIVDFVIAIAAVGATLSQSQGKSCRVRSSTTRSSLHLSIAARCDTSLRKTTQTRLAPTYFQNHCHFHAQSLATITSQRPESRTRIRPPTTSMATPQFPSRPFPGLGRASTVGQQQQQQAPPNANTYQAPSYGGPSNTFNDRGGAGPGQRERQERERAERERIERERREAEERAGALDALSEEQREEINEAVSFVPP